ncbi:MAG TPA: hypothetical protein VLG36_02300 [Candidatus Chromulinivoraceae bacterium]|nr:hypothetical protein [Candidatus Chromulinivoraceae bacterium]
MRISTKTLASLLLVTAVAVAAPGIGKRPGVRRRQESQFDRLLQRHDRKAELRAEVLGIAPYKLKEMQKKMAFEEITRQSGFTSVRGFRFALLGKLKDELHHRGWTPQRIERYVVARSSRLG